MPLQTVVRVEKKPLRLDDEMQFIRSWFEKPLSTGAVMPSSKALARTMAQYVDPQASGPVIELGPGTGPVTEALVQRGVDPSRLVLVEFNPDFCRLLRTRLRLIADAMGLLAPGAPFVQFTYAMVPPIPKALSGIKAEASELIWLNLPPARVWVYRGR